jgi:prepilin-type N-terminal cleavage/methylation domain-containing protein
MRGFTLIELVLVMLLASVLVVALLPRAPTKESLTISARAEQLASDLRYVQSLSMTRGSRYCVSLTASAYSLTTTDAGNNCLGVTEPHPALLTQPIAICIGCMSWTNLPASVIQFDGLGTPYTAAATALANNAVITIADSGSTRTITISPITGRVLVQ